MKANWLLLMVAMSVVACTGESSVTTPAPGTVSVTPPLTASPSMTAYAAMPKTCPKKLDELVRDNDIPGTAEAVVPGEPVLLVLCSFRGRMVVRDVREVQRIARALNEPSRRLDPKRERVCTLSLAPPLGLFFGYENGDVLLVTFGSCRAYWNGRSEAWLPRVIQRHIWSLAQER